jgi:uncharacterized protein YjbI with pentapeptide repeats
MDIRRRSVPSRTHACAGGATDCQRTSTSGARCQERGPAISGRLSGIRFEPPRKVWFEDAHLEDVDFSRLKIDFSVAADSSVDRCDFSRSVIAGSLSGAPGRAVFRDRVFDRANLRNAAPGNGRFVRGSFDHADERTH